MAISATVATTAQARTLEVGPGREFPAPSAAAAVARDGDHVVIAPGQYTDCAVWAAGHLTIEGSGRPEDTVIADKSCWGKGLFVITGADATVRNLTLARARVPDDNGAGIRSEAPNLTVDGVRFVDDQDGILGGTGTVVIRNSTFLRDGICTSWCAHGIYTGHAALLHVENSTFTATRQGHHIKSRALRTEIVGCTITDGPDGTASYQVEVPNGGALLVRDSHFEKGPKSQNRIGAIVLGAEEITQPTPEITITGNGFDADGGYRTYFVVNRTATPAMLNGNTLHGNATPLLGPGTVQ